MAFAQDQLDDLGRLNHANQARKNSQHTALGATGNQARRWRFGVEAAVARTVLGGEYRSLSLEAEDAPVNIGLAEQHASVIDQVPGREIIGAVGNDVVISEQVESIRRRECCLVSNNLDMRVDAAQPVARGVELRTSDIGGGVDDLALQVGEIDNIEIHDAELADAGCGKI